MKYKVRNKNNGQEFEATEAQVEAFKKGPFARRFTYTPIQPIPTPPEAVPESSEKKPKAGRPKKKKK